MRKRLRIVMLSVLVCCLAVVPQVFADTINLAPVTYTGLAAQSLGTAFQTAGWLFHAVNETGQTWTDFHFALAPFIPPPGPGIIFGGYTGQGTFTISSDHQTLDVVGLNIPNHSTYTGILSIATLENTAGIIGFPTTTAPPGPPPSVPEPASLALLGTGLLGVIGGVQRKLRR